MAGRGYRGHARGGRRGCCGHAAEEVGMSDEVTVSPADVALKALADTDGVSEFVAVWRKVDGTMSYGFADADPAVIMGLLAWAAHEIMHESVEEVEE